MRPSSSPTADDEQRREVCEVGTIVSFDSGMNRDSLEVDLFVVGGGMAGMTAAAFAAQHGARVIVAERATEIGGSAVLSAGGMMRPDTADVLTAVNPSGDPAFAKLLVDNYDLAISWVESLGVAVTESNSAIREFIGYPTSFRGIDVIGYIERCKASVLARGGWIVTDCVVEELLTSGGVVTGARITDRDGTTCVKASYVLLATGGFQGNADLRAQYLGPEARHMLVRANPTSRGDGLRLGLQVGGTLSGKMDRYYGHTVPWPLNHPFLPRDFVRICLDLLSMTGILLDHNGQRFADETIGYYRNSQVVLRQRGSRALLVGDAAVRAAGVAGGAPEKTLGRAHIDRIAEAKASGAHVVESDSLDGLDESVSDWGYAGVKPAIEGYNEGLRSGVLDPPRRRNRNPVSAPPFFAVEIQPTITNTWGGLRVDTAARVIGADGSPIPGLLAAGGDVGGIFYEAYSGGLIIACVLGLRAAQSVIATEGIPTDR